MAPPRPPSPSRTTTSTTTLDEREKLKCYRIHVDTERRLPEPLQRHVCDVVCRPRDPAVAQSPNAKRIVQRRRIAAQQNEINGNRHFAPFLLPLGEANLELSAVAIPLVTHKAELSLNRFFLPGPPDAATKSTWKDLSQPRPDSCVGYVSRSDAAAAGFDAPFSHEEESILNDYVLTKALYMPYLTGQWKAPTGTEGLYAAQNQAARDGAVVVNHLHDLYRVAYGDSPSVVETCHFSVVCDVQYAEIWVHWREGMEHYMEMVRHGACRSEAEMLDIRCALRNINDYAVNERLESIRSALTPFAEAKKAKRPYPSVREPLTIAAPPSQSSLLTAGVALPPPATPSSVASEPIKKRRRLGSDSGFGE
jgi:hypothetical protein